MEAPGWRLERMVGGMSGNIKVVYIKLPPLVFNYREYLNQVPEEYSGQTELNNSNRWGNQISALNVKEREGIVKSLGGIRYAKIKALVYRYANMSFDEIRWHTRHGFDETLRVRGMS